MKNKLKKIDYNSPVVLSFVIISFISLILGYITNGYTTQTFFCVYRSSLLNPLTYLRLFTYVLGHANLSHFVGNMTLFLVIGPMLEEKYGSRNLLIMFAITALVTALLELIIFPSGGLVGASGIVFMMIILSSVTSVKDGTIPLTMILVAFFYLGDQIITGLFTADNVSQSAHILGGIMGGIFGFYPVGGRKRSK